MLGKVIMYQRAWWEEQELPLPGSSWLHVLPVNATTLKTQGHARLCAK